MGDRGNIIVLDQLRTPIFLYTHWKGRYLPSILQNALAKRCRWDDPSYLTRIIFCGMIKGYEEDSEGFGISASFEDNEHNYLFVDPRMREVRIIKKFSPSNCSSQSAVDIAIKQAAYSIPNMCLAKYSFEEFISLDVTKLKL